MRKDEVEFVRAGTVYEDPTGGERTEVIASPLDVGDRYRVRLTIAPASRPERHRHPTLTEAFVVRDGEVRLRVGREVSVLHPDDRGVVPAGATHAVWNPADRPAVLDVDISSSGPKAAGQPPTSSGSVRPMSGSPTPEVARVLFSSRCWSTSSPMRTCCRFPSGSSV